MVCDGVFVCFLPDDNNPNRTLPNRCKIFSKQQWGGYEAKSVTLLEHPTKYVVISHTAGHSCFESKTCSYFVRNIQNLHRSQPAYDDIGYNFLIGGDGNVYEGRGWDFASMHSGFVRNKNIAICFMGNFVKDSPTYIQVSSCEQLIDLGVKLGKLDTNYKVVAHNQTYNTLSPGTNIYSIISTWPHFYVPSADDPV
ncbi:hypothetical protein PR048_033684 [Dryococelus australis]|uniref:Peptidoglycan-recognition protein n=1 Tax=Dryococelus australis TaxID=614101 RepID=A0ABQ9G0Z6_9NEOP|nr:hypothetical protein PR048_033684 [Dryococelus australis]